MSEVFDCGTPEGLKAGIAAAVQAVREGKVVVLPTDTVYGLGADAFAADAVASLLAAKGRGREMPPPVLVPNQRTVDGLAREVPRYVHTLVKSFWPGPLTMVLKSQSSLTWDLGETNGTVALRMPDSEVALALLAQTGPMAVTSANRTGSPAARSAAEAQDQLGDAVAVYLDAGEATGTGASTILDCTGDVPVTLREGSLTRADVDAVLDAWHAAVEAGFERAALEAAATHAAGPVPERRPRPATGRPTRRRTAPGGEAGGPRRVAGRRPRGPQ